MKKLALPLGLGLTLCAMTVLGVLSVTFTACLDACQTAEDDASAQCCTTNGGIQNILVTVPEDCSCPSNTTFLGMDTYYGVKKCDCNDC